jgi:hypothetical protein
MDADAVATAAFVFLAGLTLAGLAGSTMEIVSGCRLSLREPFVSPTNVSRSLVLVLLAGPFMALNEGLAAVRARHISRTAFAAILSFCFVWLTGYRHGRGRACRGVAPSIG